MSDPRTDPAAEQRRDHETQAAKSQGTKHHRRAAPRPRDPKTTGLRAPTMFDPRTIFGCCGMVALGWALRGDDMAMSPLRPVRQEPKRVVAPQRAVGDARRCPHPVEALAAVTNPGLATVGVTPIDRQPVTSAFSWPTKPPTVHPPKRASSMVPSMRCRDQHQTRPRSTPRATPAEFVPHQPRNPPKRRHVHQLHLRTAVRPQPLTATIPG